jgi:hypothetical protein
VDLGNGKRGDQRLLRIDAFEPAHDGRVWGGQAQFADYVGIKNYLHPARRLPLQPPPEPLAHRSAPGRACLRGYRKGWREARFAD